MEMIMKFNDEDVKVLKATGYNDGYYWDLNAVIKYKGDTYQIVNAGSMSGYISTHKMITKGTFDRLYGEKQIDIFYMDQNSTMEWLAETITELLSRFQECNAKESWSLSENNSFPYSKMIFVDGVEQNE